MSYQQREGSGALFKNDKQGKESRPDYRGSVTIGGTEYELAGWMKQSQKGNPYMSLSAKPKQARQEPPQTQSRNMQPDDEFDSDLPF